VGKPTGFIEVSRQDVPHRDVAQRVKDFFEIDLPLSAFAAGEYLIEINAKTSSGTAQQIVAFRVGR
jgi:hypothetical protein